MDNQKLNPTPRDRFRSEKKWVEQHHDLLQRPELERAMDYVMLEHSRLLGQNAKADNAATGLKLQGAIEFCNLFRTFTETRPAFQSVQDIDNLRPTDQPKRS